MIYTMVIQLSSSLGLNIVFALGLRENKRLIVLYFKASSQIFVIFNSAYSEMKLFHIICPNINVI